MMGKSSQCKYRRDTIDDRYRVIGCRSMRRTIRCLFSLCFQAINLSAAHPIHSFYKHENIEHDIWRCVRVEIHLWIRIAAAETFASGLYTFSLFFVNFPHRVVPLDQPFINPFHCDPCFALLHIVFGRSWCIKELRYTTGSFSIDPYDMNFSQHNSTVQFQRKKNRRLNDKFFVK